MGARRRTPAELAAQTGIAINHIGKYLQTLVDLRFVRGVLSEDAKNRALTRITRYEIRDPSAVSFSSCTRARTWSSGGGTLTPPKSPGTTSTATSSAVRATRNWPATASAPGRRGRASVRSRLRGPRLHPQGRDRRRCRRVEGALRSSGRMQVAEYPAHGGRARRSDRPQHEASRLPRLHEAIRPVLEIGVHRGARTACGAGTHRPLRGAELRRPAAGEAMPARSGRRPATEAPPTSRACRRSNPSAPETRRR